VIFRDPLCRTAQPENGGETAKKKGRSQSKRPKSREETPKEGSGNAERRRTPSMYDRTAQKASGADLFFDER
jgi:hypothetical protein